MQDILSIHFLPKLKVKKQDQAGPHFFWFAGGGGGSGGNKRCMIWMNEENYSIITVLQDRQLKNLRNNDLLKLARYCLSYQCHVGPICSHSLTIRTLDRRYIELSSLVHKSPSHLRYTIKASVILGFVSAVHDDILLAVLPRPSADDEVLLFFRLVKYKFLQEVCRVQLFLCHPMNLSDVEGEWEGHSSGANQKLTVIHRSGTSENDVFLAFKRNSTLYPHDNDDAQSQEFDVTIIASALTSSFAMDCAHFKYQVLSPFPEINERNIIQIPTSHDDWILSLNTIDSITFVHFKVVELSIDDDDTMGEKVDDTYKSLWVKTPLDGGGSSIWYVDDFPYNLVQGGDFIREEVLRQDADHVTSRRRIHVTDHVLKFDSESYISSILLQNDMQFSRTGVLRDYSMSIVHIDEEIMSMVVCVGKTSEITQDCIIFTVNATDQHTTNTIQSNTQAFPSNLKIRDHHLP